jgi:hypothetical protein
MTHFVKSGIVGGIVFFVWQIISWMVLPWHMMTIHHLDNPRTVASAVVENMPTECGPYAVPNFYYPGNENVSEEQLQNDVDRGISRPLLFIAAHPKDANPRSPAVFIGLLIVYIITGGLISYLMSHMHNFRYMKRVVLVTLFGLTMGIMSYFPFCFWWGVSAGFVTVMVLDLVIGWFLAGLVMMKITTFPRTK